MGPKIRTFKDKIRDAIRAFKGSQIGSIIFGVDIKQCKDCKYKRIYDECFTIDDCDREFLEKYADKFDRVNILTRQELEAVLKHAEETKEET